MDESEHASTRPQRDHPIDIASADIGSASDRELASETNDSPQKTVASPDITVDFKRVSDPLTSTPNFFSDDSLSANAVGIATSDVAAIPQYFGRYRVDVVLGRGGFGAVYRAWDDQLERAVAIKVTYRNKLDPVFREMFLTEARTVAKLDHSAIVPVHDVGQTESGDYFVVSKLIDGRDLAERLKAQRYTCEQAVDIVSSIARALHYAHSCGLVHRDVKPGNILIDDKGNAFLTDFGLALSENELGHGSPLVGTLLYMSPEQARREGNRVDGRSDIYSLGVVLYQLLTGRTPFRSPEALALLHLIATTDVRPPRQVDDTIPPEVEQVCLKALSRSPSERYSTAKDFADALKAAIAPSVVGGTLPVELRVERFDMLVSRDRAPFVTIDQAAPLRSGDHVRFLVGLSRAAYAGLVWIDSQGAIEDIFPNDPEVGHRGSEPIRRLDSPQQLDRGWPVLGPGGIETAVLVISDEPLPQDIGSLMPFSAGLPRRQVPLARYEASRLVSAASSIDAPAAAPGTRALGHQTIQVYDPVLNLLEELRKQYDIIQAVSIRHDND